MVCKHEGCLRERRRETFDKKRIPELHKEYVLSDYQSLWICHMQVDLLEPRILRVRVRDSLDEVVSIFRERKH